MKVVGYLKCIVPFLVAFGVQIVVSILGSLVYGIVVGFQLALGGETDPNAVGNALANSMLSSEVLILISAVAAATSIIIFGLWYKKLNKDKVKLETNYVFQPKNFALIILLGICLQIGVSFVLNLIAALKPEWFESYMELMEQLVMENSIISVIYVGLIAPISEELIFRGVILEKSKKYMPLVAANIFQALLFGIYHMNLVQGTYAFLIGIFFGFICIKLKSIYGAILLHMAINIGGIVLDLVSSDELAVSNVIIIIITLLAVAGIVFITNYFRKFKVEEGYTVDINEV